MGELMQVAIGYFVGGVVWGCLGTYLWRRRGNREVYQVKRGKGGRFE